MDQQKTNLGISVLDASRQRIQYIFDTFAKVTVSFSAGKDSSVMFHLVMDEAIKRNRKVAVLMVDLEAQYQLTIDHAQHMFDLYSDHIEPYWVCLPIALRNAVSQFEPKWTCWEPEREADWVRQPPKMGITDQSYFPFYRYNMEFEEFVPEFSYWYSKGELTACLVGIRTGESLNRYRTIAGHGTKYKGKNWINFAGESTWTAYPIYDWKTQDIWTYNGKFNKSYNRLYDRMHQAGLSLHQQRICQPYGDDQRRGLWLFHIIEPETWSKVVARVNGANQGALYASQSGNILGRIKIDKPEGHTWQSFSMLLLESMPPRSRDHFKDKIAVFLKWWIERGYPDGIPDQVDGDDEAKKAAPSWRRIAKVLLRNDYWCKGLSFSQTKSDAYTKYKKLMEKRRNEWNIFPTTS